MNPREADALKRLYRDRPRRPFLRISLAVVFALMIGAWWLEDFGLDGLLSPRRLANLDRFLGELRPHPLQGTDFEWSVAVRWASDLMADKGWEAMWITLALSVSAMILAAAAGSMLALPAARNWSTATPYVSSNRPNPRLRRWAWRGLNVSTRLLLIFLRAIPEYVWAFLLLAMLGPMAWPAVLALALHNAGIVGRLTSEAIENLDASPLEALRGLGAQRLPLAWNAIFPLIFSRFLLFFFYRWETCVREATVLGMLGIVSLGYWIQDARARNHYDEMFFLVMLGAVLVLAGDFLSAWARGVVRRAE